MIIDRLPEASPRARELAGRVDADAMAEGVSAEILRRCYAEHADDPGFVDALDRSVRDNIRAIVGLLAGRVELESVTPADALAFADLSASLDIPAAMLPRAYQVGVGDFWRQWFDRCRIEAAEQDIPLDELVREPTILLFAYIDHILESVVGQYDQTRADMVRTREHLRRTVLAQVLDGSADTSDPAELELALAYPCARRTSRSASRRPTAPRWRAARRRWARRRRWSHQSGARRWTVWLADHDATPATRTRPCAASPRRSRPRASAPRSASRGRASRACAARRGGRDGGRGPVGAAQRRRPGHALPRRAPRRAAARRPGARASASCARSSARWRAPTRACR